MVIYVVVWIIRVGGSKRFVAVHATGRRRNRAARLVVSHVELLWHEIRIRVIVGIRQVLLLCVDGGGRVLAAIGNGAVKELDSLDVATGRRVGGMHAGFGRRCSTGRV